MSTSQESLAGYFEKLKPMYLQLVAAMSNDGEAALEKAGRIFEDMIPDMAYADDPRHPMADSVFGCSAALAVFLALRDEGVDEHQFGHTFLTGMRDRIAAMPVREPEADEVVAARVEKLVASGEASQQEANPGEFVFEAQLNETGEQGWSMNIHSCGICHAFSKHDAMALVPYMCATDDVMSDWGQQGLARSGTIALGAHHCDFDYQQGRAPDHLSDRYPERIKLENV